MKAGKCLHSPNQKWKRPKSLPSYGGWQWPQKGTIKQHEVSLQLRVRCGRSSNRRRRAVALRLFPGLSSSGFSPRCAWRHQPSPTCHCTPARAHHLPTERFPQNTWNRGNQGNFLRATEQGSGNANESGWSTYWNPATSAV